MEPNATIQELEQDVINSRRQLETEENEKLRSMYRSHIANTQEKIALLRYKEERGVKQAAYEAQGLNPQQARRKAERFDPDRPNVDSTESRLAYQASRGDEDAAARLQNKERLKGRGRFSTRTIPKYEGETTGKQTGIYESPLSGRPVIVREGSPLSIPTASRTLYTQAPAQDVWSRDYTVTARIKEPISPVPNNEPSGITETPRQSRNRFPLASATVPVTIVPEQPPSNFQGSAQPEGVGTTINVPRYFASPEERAKNLTVTEIKRPGLFDDPDALSTFSTLRGGEAIADFKSGDILGGLSAGYQYGTYRYTSGLARGVKGMITNPVETTLTVGGYYATAAAGAAVGGPAGAALAVGAVFGAQNVYEFRKGETPTIVRAAIDPIGVAGEMTPFFLLEAGRSSWSASRATKLSGKLKGQVVTAETADQISGVPSVQLRAEPLQNVRRTVQVTESSGSSRTLGVQQPTFGEAVFLTAAEIERQPTAFLTNTRVSVLQQVKPASGSVEGVSAAGKTMRAAESRLGTSTAGEVGKLASDRIIAVEARETGLSPYLERRTLIESETTFQGYDSPAAWELVVNPEQAGRAARGGTRPGEPPLQFARTGIEKKGGSVGYEPKLDFFEEFAVATPEGKALIRESPYTGAREVTLEARPYVITEVKGSVRPPAPVVEQPKPVANNVLEVEIDQPDGTVKVQQLKIEPEPLKQEQATTTLQKQKTESLFKQETVSEAKTAAQVKPDNRFKIINKAQSGKTFSEAIVRFDGLSKSRLYSGMRLFSSALSGTVTGAASRTAAAVTPAQAQDAATAQIQIPAQDVSTAQAQAQAQALSLSSAQAQAQAQASRYEYGRVTQETTNKIIVPPPVTARGKKRFLPDSFGVLVRRRGTFSSVGKGLGYEEAVKKGAGIVAATAAASFKVEPEGESKGGSPFEFLPKGRFRASKREPGVIIEKRQFRISTPGEVGEISRKGQAASRRGKKKKGILGGGFKWGL